MTRLVLIRHGESNVTVRRIIGGPASCDGLSERGRVQADALRRRLAASGELSADVLLSSTLPRALETAEILAPALRRPVVADAELIEWHPGESDGMTFDEYTARHGNDGWGVDPDVPRISGAETARQFHARVHGALGRLVHDHRGQCLVLVCHGGVIDAMVRHVLGLPILGGVQLVCENTSMSELRQLPELGVWQLVRFNDAAHLGGQEL